MNPANILTVSRDSGVWRATLGESPDKGASAVASDPFTAIELVAGRAREAGYAFDDPDAPKPAVPTPTPAPAPAPAKPTPDPAPPK